MSRCDGCGGEDCVCCGVYIEQLADEKYQRMYDMDEYDEYQPIEYEEEDEDDQ